MATSSLATSLSRLALFRFPINKLSSIPPSLHRLSSKVKEKSSDSIPISFSFFSSHFHSFPCLFAEPKSIKTDFDGVGAEGIASQQSWSPNYPRWSHQGILHATNCKTTKVSILIFMFAGVLFMGLDAIVSYADVSN